MRSLNSQAIIDIAKEADVQFTPEATAELDRIMVSFREALRISTVENVANDHRPRAYANDVRDTFAGILDEIRWAAEGTKDHA